MVVVSVLAFFSNEPSSNPAEAHNLYFQELSLRIAKLSETDKEIRPIAAECRKILLEVSTSLMLATSSSAPNGPKSPGHIKRNTFPALVEVTLPLLIHGCRSALMAAEQVPTQNGILFRTIFW